MISGTDRQRGIQLCPQACHAALLRILSSAAIALNQLYTLYALGNEAHRRFARYMKNTSTAGNRTIAGALSR